jgi:uncharacterized membrane protein YjfL (UPF0719 family)
MLLVPGIYLVFLRRHLSIRAREWAVALGVAAAAAGVALGVELGPGAPTSLLDPVLWGAAVACFVLLGVAWRVTRPPTGASDA